MIGASLLAFHGMPAFAQTQELIQELFQSDTVYPQEEGEIQLTFRPQYNRGDESVTRSALVAFEYGVTDSLQIEVEWASFLRVDSDDPEEGSAQGIGDLEIGARYSWMNISGSNAHAALGLDFTIPTGAEEKGFGDGEFAVSPIVILAANLPSLHGTHVVANFGTDVGEGAFAFDEADWLANLAFFVPVQPLVLSVELNLSAHESFFTPGLIWHASDSLEMGLGVPIGLSEEADDYRVALMLTWEFDVH